jgi:hypothetical protein
MKTLSIRTFTPEQLELRAKWKAALRSDEFKQITGVLRRIQDGDVVGHCCLGVAAEVAGAKIQLSSTVSAYKGEDTGGHMDLLPPSLRADLGLDIEDETILAVENDSGVKFATIADMLDHQEAV